ncbi:MAG TPA: hypothetical protein VD926_15370 [Acidimicrobiales bacterium]|nr:hypothetical protein [Acidimicrobiales bacterium]
MALVDQGEYDILDIIFRGASPPASLYLGLGTGSVPGETATLSDVTEPSGGSYARAAVARNNTVWPTLALVSGDYRVDSDVITFPAPTGNWGTPTYAFICTVASGTAGRLWTVKAVSMGAVNNGDPAPSFLLREALS